MKTFRFGLFLAFGLWATMTGLPASAEVLRDAPGAELDQDTGLWCFDNSCNYLRHPTDVHCICEKAVSGHATGYDRIVKCIEKRQGAWLQCRTPLRGKPQR